MNSQRIKRLLRMAFFIGLGILWMSPSVEFAQRRAARPGLRQADRKAVPRTAEERRRLKERYRRFRKLPPAEQEQLRQRQKRFEQLPEVRQKQLRLRQEYLRRLSPDQRQRVMRFQRRLQNLPPQRKRAIQRRMRRLRNLPAGEREQLLSGMPFWQRWNKDERQAFLDLLNLPVVSPSEPRSEAP